MSPSRSQRSVQAELRRRERFVRAELKKLAGKTGGSLRRLGAAPARAATIAGRPLTARGSAPGPDRTAPGRGAHPPLP